jgi:hypothetical protein
MVSQASAAQKDVARYGNCEGQEVARAKNFIGFMSKLIYPRILTVLSRLRSFVLLPKNGMKHKYKQAQGLATAATLSNIDQLHVCSIITIWIQN